MQWTRCNMSIRHQCRTRRFTTMSKLGLPFLGRPISSPTGGLRSSRQTAQYEPHEPVTEPRPRGSAAEVAPSLDFRLRRWRLPSGRRVVSLQHLGRQRRHAKRVDFQRWPLGPIRPQCARSSERHVWRDKHTIRVRAPRGVLHWWWNRRRARVRRDPGE